MTTEKMILILKMVCQTGGKVQEVLILILDKLNNASMMLLMEAKEEKIIKEMKGQFQSFFLIMI